MVEIPVIVEIGLASVVEPYRPFYDTLVVVIRKVKMEIAYGVRFVYGAVRAIASTVTDFDIPRLVDRELGRSGDVFPSIEQVTVSGRDRRKVSAMLKCSFPMDDWNKAASVFEPSNLV